APSRRSDRTGAQGVPLAAPARPAPAPDHPGAGGRGRAGLRLPVAVGGVPVAGGGGGDRRDAGGLGAGHRGAGGVPDRPATPENVSAGDLPEELTGRPLSDRDHATRATIERLAGVFDAPAMTALWEEALNAPAWSGPPV